MCYYNWFICVPIASYGCIYEKGTIEATQSFRSYYNKCYRSFRTVCKIINRNNSEQQFKHTNNICRTHIGFFTRWFDKRDKERENKSKKLTDHCNNLNREFLDAYNKAYREPRPTNPVADNFEGFFTHFSKSFGLWEEFKEHLRTAYPQLHSSINNTIEYEIKSVEKARALNNKIKQTIRQELGRQVYFQSLIQEGQPTFDDRGLIQDVIEEIDINNWEGFTADSESGRRDIVYQDRRYHVYNVDKTFIDNMAIRITNAVCTSEIRADINNYRNIKKTREENSSKANQQLGKLINNLVLGEALAGACSICLKYHDEKDIRRLQHELSQLR